MSERRRDQKASAVPAGLPKPNSKPSRVSDDALFRKVLFKPILTASGKKITACEAFLHRFTVDVCNGERGASKDDRRLKKHREKMETLAEAARKEESPVAPLIKQQDEMRRIGNLLAGAAFLAQVPEIYGCYKKSSGNYEITSGHVPYWFDLQDAYDAAPKIRRLLAKREPKKDYVVGHGKPPEATRFTPENNPAKKRKREWESPWAMLDSYREKPVTMRKRNGETVSSTRTEVSYEMMLKRAIGGDAVSRSEVIDRIIDLDRKGMFFSSATCAAGQTQAVEQRARSEVR